MCIRDSAGTTYDLEPLSRWVGREARYPGGEAPGQRLSLVQLVPNRALRAQIEEWLIARRSDAGAGTAGAGVGGAASAAAAGSAGPARRPARSPARSRRRS